MKQTDSLNTLYAPSPQQRSGSNASFMWLLLPLTLFVALIVIMLVERSGVPYNVDAAASYFLGSSELPAPSGYTEPPVEALVLYDSSFPIEQHILETVTSTLDSMRAPYEVRDVYQAPPVDLAKYKTVVLTFHHIDNMSQIRELVDWVEQGGRVLFAARPFFTENYRSLYRRLGMLSMADKDLVTYGLVFVSDLLPGAQGTTLVGSGDFLRFYTYPVQLEAASRLHLTSADEARVPLLWDVDYGQGRFVVFNTSQLAERVNRGIVGAAYSLLDDVFVYPVINSSVYLLDNFPAPIPEGRNDFVTEEYNRDIRSFFINVWWPEMEMVAHRYAIKYTGTMVQTYNNILEPPFTPEKSMEDHRYLGRRLLNSGGELALQGYNHVPFCVPKDGVNEMYDYPAWPSIQNQQQAMQALIDFSAGLFPDKQFMVYSSPAYVLCPDARQWLPQVFPQIKVISSLLLEEHVGSDVQDFREAPDGVIEFPRVVAGYSMYDNQKLALLNELGLHYVNAHLVTPDDILDPVRRNNRTWKTMREEFEAQVKWLKESLPGLRNMTASEGGMAVQRFSRLKVNAERSQDTYTIHLGDFYDEAWLMLRSKNPPASISGGTITPVSQSLYLIQADQPDIQIQIKEP